MRRHLSALALIALMVITVATAQVGPRFEVASVKPILEQPANSAAGVQITQRQARFSNVSLKDVIGFAFGMRMQQIVAPEWLGSVRVEIAGTLPETFKPADMPAMLQGLTPEDFRAAMLRSAVAGGATLPPQAFQLLENSSLSAVPDALKSLGLLLQARRAPLETVVIDSIDKTPTEN